MTNRDIKTESDRERDKKSDRLREDRIRQRKRNSDRDPETER